MNDDQDKAKHTEIPWHAGYNMGITGPTAARAGMADCEFDSGGECVDLPLEQQCEIISVQDIQQGSDTYSSVVAMLPQREPGEARATRDFIVQAANQHTALVALRDAAKLLLGTGVVGMSPSNRRELEKLIAATHEAEKA